MLQTQSKFELPEGCSDEESPRGSDANPLVDSRLADLTQNRAGAREAAADSESDDDDDVEDARAQSKMDSYREMIRNKLDNRIKDQADDCEGIEFRL